MAKSAQPRENEILRFIAILLIFLIPSASADTSKQKYKINSWQKQAIEFIKENEGFIVKARVDSDGVYRVGYSTPSKKGVRITKVEAEKELIKYTSKEVFPNIPNNLSKNHYILYADLIFNFGKAGAKQFLQNDKINCEKLLVNFSSKCGKYNLSNRRIKEYKLCVK